jgi:hypothetical protein
MPRKQAPRIAYSARTGSANPKEAAQARAEEAAQARADSAKKEKKADRLSRKLEDAGEERGQKARPAVRGGLAEAMAEVE